MFKSVFVYGGENNSKHAGLLNCGQIRSIERRLGIFLDCFELKSHNTNNGILLYRVNDHSDRIIICTESNCGKDYLEVADKIAKRCKNLGCMINGSVLEISNESLAVFRFLDYNRNTDYL